MSLAAGIVARVEGHRDNGPATRAAALAQQRASSRRRARQEQRTADDLDEAGPTAHLLEVLEELRQPLVGTRARPARRWPCGQNFEQTSRTRGLAREWRENAARWVWRFERVAARTLKRRPVAGPQQPRRREGGAPRARLVAKTEWLLAADARTKLTASPNVAAPTRLRVAQPRRSTALG